jgi:hypothetical protein
MDKIYNSSSYNKYQKSNYLVFAMDIITSMFTIVNNVGDADREYKILSKKL